MDRGNSPLRSRGEEAETRAATRSRLRDLTRSPRTGLHLRTAPPASTTAGRWLPPEPTDCQNQGHDAPQREIGEVEPRESGPGRGRGAGGHEWFDEVLSLIHISEPTR